MTLIRSLDISASGLKAQRSRLEVLSSNLANIHTTRTPEGGPYRRKDVVFRSEPVGSFERLLEGAADSGTHASKVVVEEIVERGGAFPRKYQPDHPDANSEGYVTYPNIDLMEEMANLLSATRSYEASVTVIEAIKVMGQRTLDILR